MNDECMRDYNDLKTKKAYKYLIFTMSDDMKEIIVQEKGARELSYADLYNKLQNEMVKDPKYVVVDHSYEVDGLREKIVFINWIPEGSPVKKKMIFASSKAALKQRLQGIHFEIQGTDLSEVVEEKLTEKALSLNRN